jgi:hypothetical protein
MTVMKEDTTKDVIKYFIIVVPAIDIMNMVQDIYSWQQQIAKLQTNPA